MESLLNRKRKIVEAFMIAPWQKLTFKEAKKLSKNKSNNYVHATLKSLVRMGTLIEERKGNAVLYSISDSATALNTLGFIAESYAAEAKQIPLKNLAKITKKLKTAYYSMLITGSYARNKQKERSDLDLVIICDNSCEPTAILAEIRFASKMMTPEIHPYAFRESELYEMLTNNEENYGKEIARNNLVITGGKQYYSIVMRATAHGFKG